MRLSRINQGLVEQNQDKLRELYPKSQLQNLTKALSFMRPRKLKHSFRVGATAATAGLKRKFVDAAILHDYIERGGDLSKLNNLGLSQRAMQVIKILSIDEKSPAADDTATVYDHVSAMLNDTSIDKKTKNIAIIIKMADRLDNLRRRVKQQKLTSNYYEASKKLLRLLGDHYSGPNSHLRDLGRKLRWIESSVSEFGFPGDFRRKRV